MRVLGGFIVAWVAGGPRYYALLLRWLRGRGGRSISEGKEKRIRVDFFDEGRFLALIASRRKVTLFLYTGLSVLLSRIYRNMMSPEYPPDRVADVGMGICRSRAAMEATVAPEWGYAAYT
jgi:hypothetical protein